MKNKLFFSQNKKAGLGHTRPGMSLDNYVLSTKMTIMMLIDGGWAAYRGEKRTERRKGGNVPAAD
jgi:hypothetical protein